MTLKRMLVFLVPLLLMATVLLMTSGSFGGAAADGESGLAGGLAGKDTVDLASLAFRVGVTLAVILVLIVGGVYIVRLVGGRPGLESESRMKVLDRCFLAPKRALYTVRLGDRVVVVGVTDTNISAVTEFSPDEGEALYPRRAAVPGRPIPFPETLRSFMGRLAHRNA